MQISMASQLAWAKVQLLLHVHDISLAVIYVIGWGKKHNLMNRRFVYLVKHVAKSHEAG